MVRLFCRGQGGKKFFIASDETDIIFIQSKHNLLTVNYIRQIITLFTTVCL